MKRNRLLFKMLAVAMLLFVGVSAKAVTTITVGASPASFLTIAAAYASITTETSGFIIELQSDYNPAGETYPIVLGAKSGATSAESGITIQPKAGNTAMFAFTAATEQIFDLSGATWVTIDGLDATEFVVSNTTASSTISQCVRLTADASNNTIKNITAISICQKGFGAISIVAGVVNSTGNDNNTITNCTIKDDGTTKNNCGIYVNDPLSNNTTIIYNNIENVAGITGNLGYGINITSAEGTTGTNTVSSNNIYWPATTALANITTGIYTANARTKIESNYIGYATSAHTGTASLSGNKVYGIYVVAALAFPCQYNVIANINLTGAPVALSAHAIILGAGGAGGGTFNANTMENITVTSTGACEFRILNNNATGATTKVFSNNIIRNCSAVGGTAAGIAQIMGISNYQAAASSLTYSNNQVYGLSAGYGSSTAANVVRGFSSGFSGTSGTNVVIERNLIYNLSILSTTGTTGGVIYGIFLSASGPGVIVKNNMVSLGKDFTLDNAIYGIYQGGAITAAHVYKIYHNSVYIGGAAPASPIKSTYAFYCAATGTGATTNDLKNNIFANQRTVTGTSAFHYCIGFTTLNVLKTCDNNLYWGQAGSSPLGSAAAVDQADLTAWQGEVVSGSDAASLSGDPKFMAATNAIPNLHINPLLVSQADNNGVFLTDVANDFDNDTRLGTDLKADIGADEYTYAADITSPTVVVSSLASSPTNVATIAVTITFSEAVTGFVIGDLALVNCTANNFVAISGTEYTVDITASGQGSFSVTVPVSVAADAASNLNIASNTLTYVYGTTGLALSSIVNNIYAVNNNIVVKGISLGSSISIFSTTGQLVKSINANADKSTIAVEKGVYIVKTVNQVSKVIVN